MDAGRHPPRPPWARWATAAGASAFVVLVDLTALGVVVTDPGVLGTAGDRLVSAGVLTLLGALHVECTRRVERRQPVGSHVLGAPQADLTAVWTFAAAVLLPPALFTLVAVVLCTHLCWRRSGWSGVSLRRLGFATAATVLCCTAAWAVVQLAGAGGIAALPHVGSGLLALALAIGAYAIVDRALVAATVAPGSPSRLPPTRGRSCWCCRRCSSCTARCTFGGSRRRRFRRAAHPRPGPLQVRQRRPRPPRRRRGAHRGGGRAGCRGQGARRRRAVREEEFVVLLPGLGREAGAGPYAIAERIRHRIATLAVVTRTRSGALTITGLSASVGGACYP